MYKSIALIICAGLFADLIAILLASIGRCRHPYWPDKIREDHPVPAGIAAGIGRVGWHRFRHTYSCLLREHEVDLKVQQALMRHADIRTTMNIYTQTIPKAVREANRRVVRSIMGKKAPLKRQ